MLKNILSQMVVKASMPECTRRREAKTIKPFLLVVLQRRHDTCQTQIENYHLSWIQGANGCSMHPEGRKEVARRLYLLPSVPHPHALKVDQTLVHFAAMHRYM